jgi:tetratricopeptide (TPR) repeat protein
VLIDDPASSWLSDGVAVVLEYDLSTAKNMLPLVVQDESGAIGAGASQVVRVTVEKRNGGFWAQATVTDLSSQRNTHVLTPPVANDVLVAVNQIGKDLSSNAVPFSTANVDALKIFTAAVRSKDPQQRSDLLHQAITAAPNFGLAYALLVESTPPGSPSNAAAVTDARAHENSFNAVDRTRMKATLARLEHEPLPVQARAAEAVLNIAPNDVDALVTLGSADFLRGDGGAGSQFLLKAMELSGGNANIRRQLAQGLVESKQFAQAERFVSDMPDQIICLLLQGKTNQASQIADKLVASAGSPGLQIIFRATWLAYSGQLAQASNTVKQATFNDPGVQAIALSEAALWDLLSGNSNDAQSAAAMAYKLNPKAGALPSSARLLTQTGMPPSAWRTNVQGAGLSAVAQEALLGYGFFLRGDYGDSEKVWERIRTQSGDADLRARAMLAASLMKQGRTAEARSIRVQPFLPEWGQYYDVVAFNEMRQLTK